MSRLQTYLALIILLFSSLSYSQTCPQIFAGDIVYWDVNGYKVKLEVESYGRDNRPVVALYRTVAQAEYKRIKNNTIKINRTMSGQKGFSLSYKDTQTENIYNLAKSGPLALMYKNPMVLKVLVDISYFKEMLSHPELKSDGDVGMSLSYFPDPKNPSIETYIDAIFLLKTQTVKDKPATEKIIDAVNLNAGSLTQMNKSILAITPFTPEQ